MNYSENVQKSIDYIEQHIKDDLDINTVIRQSGYSTTHFYRIFQAIIGESIKDYIRNRKLSDAAIELSASNKRLIDIAFEYGFHSQEVFTRAFTRLFNVTPGRYRVQRNKMVLYEKVNAYQKMLVNRGNYIEPKIILDKEFQVVGMERIVKPGYDLIRSLWGEFNARKSEINNIAAPDKSLGICEYMPDITDESEFGYMACVEVTGRGYLPEGMITKKIPYSKYAVFTHVGSMDRLKTTYNKIYGAWLPYSGYELAELDTIELYYPVEGCAEHRLDIYIPVK